MVVQVTRRQALALGLGVAGSAGLAACTTGDGHGSMAPTMTGGATPVPPPPVPPPGPELADPPSVISVGGRLSTALQARTATVDLRVGHPVHTYTYDGAVPGRTWDVRPGDVLEVQLQNALPALQGHDTEMHKDRPHQWTTTNLHTHGLHVSPSGASDNVFVSVAPGDQHAYRIEIPTDHSAGFYWYHPHQHGAVCQQLRAGMAGAIIVRGDLDEVAEVKAARERVLVMQAVELGRDHALMDPIPMPTKAQAFYPRTQIYWTVNGTMNPTITMHPGEVQRWRIVNAAEGKVAALTLAGHELHAIAWDGLTLGAPETAPTVELSPANRVEVMVKAGAPGTYLLTLQPGSSQHPNLHAQPSPLDVTDTSELEPRTLATVVVSGSGPDMSLPTALPAYDPPIRPVARTRTVRYTVDRDPNGEFVSFGIDDQTFDPARAPYRITLGTAEEWTVVNDSDAGHLHSFHIHVNPFKVVAIDGKPLATPLWRDTWLLPVAKGGSFTFRSNFDDFTGRFVEHCHILSHEDLGMMEALEVVDP